MYLASYDSFWWFHFAEDLLVMLKFVLCKKRSGKGFAGKQGCLSIKYTKILN